MNWFMFFWLVGVMTCCAAGLLILAALFEYIYDRVVKPADDNYYDRW